MFVCKLCREVIPSFGTKEQDQINSLISNGTQHMMQKHVNTCSLAKTEHVSLINMVSAATLFLDVQPSEETKFRKYKDNLLIAIINAAAVLLERGVRVQIDQGGGPEVSGGAEPSGPVQ